MSARILPKWIAQVVSDASVFVQRVDFVLASWSIKLSRSTVKPILWSLVILVLLSIPNCKCCRTISMVKLYSSV